MEVQFYRKLDLNWWRTDTSLFEDRIKFLDWLPFTAEWSSPHFHEIGVFFFFFSPFAEGSFQNLRHEGVRYSIVLLKQFYRELDRNWWRTDTSLFEDRIKFLDWLPFTAEWSSPHFHEIGVFFFFFSPFAEGSFQNLRHEGVRYSIVLLKQFYRELDRNWWRTDTSLFEDRIKFLDWLPFTAEWSSPHFHEIGIFFSSFFSSHGGFFSKS